MGEVQNDEGEGECEDNGVHYVQGNKKTQTRFCRDRLVLLGFWGFGSSVARLVIQHGRFCVVGTGLGGFCRSSSGGPVLDAEVHSKYHD